MTKRNVWITSSDEIAKVCDLLPANRGRQLLVTSLIKAYQLDRECLLVDIKRAKREDLERFHGKEYIACLLQKRHYEEKAPFLRKRSVYADEPDGSKGRYDQNHEESTFSEESTDAPPSETDSETKTENWSENLQNTVLLDRFGLHFDCPVFPHMDEYVRLVASTSISAAGVLVREAGKPSSPVVLNWYGGRHHCMKNRAGGFCYVNDIVLAINVLRNAYRRVFYLDIDLHHGDGVESAFSTSRNVVTCSIHRYDVGFFPGTGSLESSTPTKLNIPTRKGVNDESMGVIITDVVIPYIRRFLPQAIVLQAGCDGLATDENKEWNMTIKGYGDVMQSILRLKLPTLVLGGGGYNHTETAKCWAYLTKICTGNTEEWDVIPEHSQLDAYENDGFRFWTDENSRIRPRKDENDTEYLQKVRKHMEDMAL